MSFENMKETKFKNTHDRSCAIIVNFNKKEQLLVKNICNLFGLKDLIVLDYKNSNNVVRDILDGNKEDISEDGLRNKAILFNNLHHTMINSLLQNLKKVKIKNVLSAVVTETSVDWTIDNILKNLIEERQAIKNGEIIDHKK